MELNDKHQSVIETFSKDYAYHEDQRDMANEDIRFIVAPGGHWEGFLENHYEGRPKMQYDMVDPAVQKFMGEWSTNEVMPKFKDEDANDDIDDAELADGIFRARWRKEGGSSAAKYAVFEAATGGFGAIRLGTRYLDEYDVEDERQEITFKSIKSACTKVVFDSSAEEMDKRDANHVSVIWEYTPAAFEKKWPGKTPVSAATPDDKRHFNWSTKDAIFVVEHYEKTEKVVTVHLFVNLLGERYEVEEQDYEMSKPELLLQGFKEVKKRKVKRVYIEKSILSGQEYLEEPRRIVGKILPIIPIYAYWAFTDGQEHYWGLVRKEKDPQRILNMNVSNMAELASTSPKEAPIFDPSQVKGLEGRWAQAHLGKKNFHLARALRDKQGNIIQTGPIGKLSPPQIDPATQGLIQFTTDHIRTTTGGMPQDVEDPDASGKAILAVNKRVDMYTYTIMDNIAKAMVRIGECFIHMAKDIYKDDRRTVHTIAEDGTEGKSKLNQVEMVKGQMVKRNDLSKRRFEVYASVGPSFESQRREAIELLKELAALLPEDHPLKSAVISAIVDNLEGVGLQAIKDLNRKLMLMSGLVEPKTDKEKKMLAEVQAQQTEPDGMQQLIASQTALNFAEAQGREATNMDKVASAEKKQAEAAKILQSIGLDKVRTIMEMLEKQQAQLAQ